uniref:Uncharacterized protein MANES_16G082900 n=1 Tax=Rhizophora mucronata TaxID=61149 RepID=A0A2P2J1M5_RHIMU
MQLSSPTVEILVTESEKMPPASAINLRLVISIQVPKVKFPTTKLPTLNGTATARYISSIKISI